MTDTYTATEEDIKCLREFTDELEQSLQPQPGTDKYCINVQGEVEELLPIKLHCDTYEREEVKGVGI